MEKKSCRPPPASFLTDDLVVEILSRLPYRSLCRFKCVSTSWLALCSDPALRKKSPQTLSGFFYHSVRKRDPFEPSDHRCHFTNLSGRGRPMVDPSLSFLPSCARILFVDCCNGLLLCRCFKMPSLSRSYYVVCNPATEKWTVLPDTKAMQGFYTVRLGFDPAVSSNFRVFLLVQSGVGNLDIPVTGVQIYSPETGEWTYRQSRWGDKSAVYTDTMSVLLDGVMHFTSTGSSVLTVDMEGKTWGKILTPVSAFSSFLGRSKGYLYLGRIDHSKDPQLSIWMLKDYGSKQWILMHTVRTLELFEPRHLTFHWYNKMIAMHPDHNLIFFTVGMQRNLVSYNMDSRIVHVICALGDYCVDTYLPYVPCFLEWLSDEC